MSEEWRIVADFPDYAVSSFGQVKRIRPDTRGRVITAQPLKASPVRGGYLKVKLSKHCKEFNRTVHRLVCEAFHGPAPTSEHEAAHEDGCRTNNRADNLLWKTPVENAADVQRHGTYVPRAKLTKDQVRAIRADPRTTKDIALEYGVSRGAVRAVRNGSSWRSIGGDVQPSGQPGAGR